jgi:hypothetical protein
MKLLENSEWVDLNFSDCDLGNVSRTKRLKKVAANMLENPDASLAEQNGEWKDVKAAYRFFARKEASLSSIAGSHWQLTRKSQGKHKLLISDTTDLNYYSHKATKGFGMLGDGKGRGIQLHSCLMVDGESRTLNGIAGALTFYRKRTPTNETRAQRLKRSRESQLWGDLVKEVGPPPVGVHWTHVFDRGGDNFEAICHIIEQRCGWIIRAAKLSRKVIDNQGNTVWLSDAIEDGKELGSYELILRSRPGQPARTATVKVSATKVTIPRPAHCSAYVKKCGINSIECNVVIVKEVDPPKGTKPILWILLTSLPTDSLDDAWNIIEWYETRWLIEEYHKVIKTGCNIEGHALRTAAKLEALIGLVAVVGVRLLELKTQARSAPNTRAKGRVPEMWLKAIKGIRKNINVTAITLYDFFRELAKVGGFLGRTHDGQPGWQTIWRGYCKLNLIVKGLEIAKACG